MPFDISDTKSFDENLAAFLKSLETDEPKLAAVLKDKLLDLLQGKIDQTDVWDALDAATAQEQSP